MSIVETMARAYCVDYGSDPDEWHESHHRHVRAALRAIKPEDVSDGMMASARIRLGLDSFDLSDETLRRAIAAAIAAGADPPEKGEPARCYQHRHGL